MQKLPDFVPALSHHLKPLMRDGSQFTCMLFHPCVDGGIPLDSAVESQQFRSHRRSLLCFRDQWLRCTLTFPPANPAMTHLSFCYYSVPRKVTTAEPKPRPHTQKRRGGGHPVFSGQLKATPSQKTLHAHKLPRAKPKRKEPSLGEGRPLQEASEMEAQTRR
jgi:hypothetical protein